MRPFLKSSKREKSEHLDDDLVVVAHKEKDEKSMAACLSREMQKVGLLPYITFRFRLSSLNDLDFLPIRRNIFEDDDDALEEEENELLRDVLTLQCFASLRHSRPE